MNDSGPIVKALAAIAGEAEGSGAEWLVGGSAGLQLRELPLDKPPRDLDLYADERDAALLHEALQAYAVDEPAESVSEIYRSVLSHYRIEGVNVELVGGFVVASGADRYEVEVRRVLFPLRTVVYAGRYAVGLVPLAHELWFNALRGRPDRMRLIGEAVRAEPERHLTAFRRIEACNSLSAESVSRIGLLISDQGREDVE